MVVNQLNSWFPGWELPTMEELLFKAKAPDWLTFGSLSAATKNVPGFERGVYMGSSMNAVGLDDITSTALAPFVMAMGSAVGTSAQYLLSEATDKVNPPSADDMYKSQKQLTPGIFQPWIDRFHYMHP